MSVKGNVVDTVSVSSAVRGPVPRISPLFLTLVALAAAGGALTLVASRLTVTVGIVVLVLAGWAVSLCLHEFGHALVADRGGDHSVRLKGYLTLDIRRYSHAGVTVVLPLLFLLIGGIPLPGAAVWIDRSALRSRAATSVVSLAGPAVNLVLAVLLGVAVPFAPLALATGLSFLALIQVLAFVLNLLPIPGLDGFGVIDPYLPATTRVAAARVGPYAPLALVAVIFLIPQASALLFSVASAVFGAAGGSEELAGIGQALFFFWRP